MRLYTDQEWEELPHVILTGDNEWDPSVLDYEIDDDDDKWFDAISDIKDTSIHRLFDERGNYKKRTIVNRTVVTDSHLQEAAELAHHLVPTKDLLLEAYHRESTVHGHEVTPREPDYESLRPNFAWQSAATVKLTMENTTQNARLPMSTHLKTAYKSPNPAMNVHRRDESVATDTVYSDTPAVDSGEMCAQFYCGLESHVCDVYGMKTDSQFVNTLEDTIKHRGAPSRLISDRAQVEISNRVQDILRAMYIGSWQSEAYHQHQNPAER